MLSPVVKFSTKFFLEFKFVKFVIGVCYNENVILGLVIVVLNILFSMWDM